MDAGPGKSRTPSDLFASDGITVLFRNWKTILGFSLAVGLLVLPAAHFGLRKTYEASATLVIVTPKIASDLKPASLTVQGYQKLLESDAAIEETRRRLIDKGILKQEEPFRLKDELETRIFVSRFSETTTLAPMVQVVVRGVSAENAAAAANVWAEVSISRIRDIMAGSTTSQVQFVDEQYTNSAQRLDKQEADRLASSMEYQKRLDEVARAWDEKIVDLKKETADLVASFQTESKRVTEEFAAAGNLQTRRGQLQALRKAYYDLQLEQASVTSMLQQRTGQMEALRNQLRQISPTVSLRKAITDEALWRSLVTDAKELDWKLLQDRSVVTQEVNPIHRDLAIRLSQMEADASSLEPRSKQLVEELATLSEKLKALDISNRADEAKLEKISRDREAGLEQLQDRRAMLLADLTRQRTRALGDLILERDALLMRLDRSLSQERTLNSELAKNFNQATLAKSQQNLEDVRLGAPAVPMQRPLPRGVVMYTLCGLIGGALLGLGIAVVRDAARGTLAS